jgi:hypothetical protein
MFSEDQEFLVIHTGQLPATLPARAAAAVLGFREHHIGILVNAGLLTPIGPRNGDYTFVEETIQQLRKDKKALIKMRAAISNYYVGQNSHKRRREADGDLLPGNDHEQ